jgi:hypothetical protein
MSEAQWWGESHVYGFLSVRSRTLSRISYGGVDMLILAPRAYRDCKEQWVRYYPAEYRDGTCLPPRCTLPKTIADEL